MNENNNNELENDRSETPVTGDVVPEENICADGEKAVQKENDSIAEASGDEEETAKKQKARIKSAASAFDIAEMLAVCATVILLLFTFCFRLTVVDGPSMNNTLTNGDYLVVQSIGYTPKRGDIIVVQDPTAAPYDKPLIKRLIAVGGDTVDIDFTTWTVTVNGEVIDESEYLYLDPEARFTANYSFPITVEEGCIFVMGDNRNHSADSRVSTIGQIDERCIVGKAMLRLFPISNFKIFN